MVDLNRSYIVTVTKKDGTTEDFFVSAKDKGTARKEAQEQNPGCTIGIVRLQ